MRNRTVQPIRISSQSRSRTNATWTPSRRLTRRTSCPTDPNPPKVPDSTTRLKTRTRLQEAPPQLRRLRRIKPALRSPPRPTRPLPSPTRPPAPPVPPSPPPPPPPATTRQRVPLVASSLQRSGPGRTRQQIKSDATADQELLTKNYLTLAFAQPLKP
jgi:hypothetical protein